MTGDDGFVVAWPDGQSGPDDKQGPEVDDPPASADDRPDTWNSGDVSDERPAGSPGTGVAADFFPSDALVNPEPIDEAPSAGHTTSGAASPGGRLRLRLRPRKAPLSPARSTMSADDEVAVLRRRVHELQSELDRRKRPSSD